MRPRLIAAAIMVAASVSSAFGLGGCASVTRVISPRPVCDNPLIVPSSDGEAVWKATVVAVNEYFTIRTENRLAHTIVTDPVAGATLLEPWRSDSVGFQQRLESTMQTMRRFARIQVDPVPGRGYTVKVEVFKELEDLSKPDRQMFGRAVFNNDFPLNRTREIVGPIPVPNQWIPRGRDALLEQAILNRVRDNLFL